MKKLYFLEGEAFGTINPLSRFKNNVHAIGDLSIFIPRAHTTTMIPVRLKYK